MLVHGTRYIHKSTLCIRRLLYEVYLNVLSLYQACVQCTRCIETSYLCIRGVSLYQVYLNVQSLTFVNVSSVLFIHAVSVSDAYYLNYEEFTSNLCKSCSLVVHCTRCINSLSSVLDGCSMNQVYL